MKITGLILTWIVLGLILMPGELQGANCPYCGRSYGEPAPGDEARVYGLRTAHERNCPARGDTTRSRRSIASYGVVTIYNPNDTDIKYKMQSRYEGSWSSATVKAHDSYYHWQPLPANFRINFDSSFEPGDQDKSYDLDHNIISGRKPHWNEGKKYELTIRGKHINLHTASEETKQSYMSYGVVTIVNTSDVPISYQIKYRKNGSWTDVTTVKAQSTYYHWVELPASFEIKFDRSFSEGYQSKTVSLGHNLVKGRKPTADDGRDYRLIIEDDKIKLQKSKAKNHKLASLTANDVSLVGSGAGQTKRGTFGDATRAKGTFIVTYMPRIGGVIPTINDSWKAEMVDEMLSPTNSLYKTQIWKFVSKEFGVATATLQGSSTGASGTATGWRSAVPGNPDGDKFKITFGVQFAGREVSLISFAKAY